MRIVAALIFFFATISPAFGVVQGKTVAYREGNTLLKGYIAYDDALSGKRPGILVVHEWWGHNEYARRRARMLAKLGYTALAVDMYGEGKEAHHPKDAGKFSREIKENMKLMRGRFKAAMTLIQNFSFTDPKKIGAIGYCFGGGVVLQMARDGVDLKGVASFHGGLSTPSPAKKGAVKARILVLHGGADRFSTSKQIDAFKKEMKEAGVNFRFISYPGALHSFTNPDADIYGKKFNLPIGYNEKADRQSWEEMKRFFNEVFTEKP